MLKIAVQCDADDKWLPLKEKALRARLDVRRNHGATLQELGNTLCKMEKFEEGVDFLTRAREVGADSASLSFDSDKARIEGASSVIVDGTE